MTPIDSCAVQMGIGGTFSSATNRAVDELVACGCAVAAASGSSSAGCDGSPASASSAFAVSAMTPTDEVARSSGFGACIRLYAPGVDMLGPWIGSASELRSISGSSSATAIVAGVMAKVLEDPTVNLPHQVYTAIISSVIVGVLTNVPNGTANRLIHHVCS